MNPTATFRLLRRLELTCAGTAALLALATATQAQTTQYFAGDGSALTASKYGASASGPFTSAFVSGNIMGFAVANGTGTGGTVTVGGFNATENFTLGTASGTISNASNGVINIAVAAGKTLDFGAQAFTGSQTAGYTYNGNATGVLAFAGGAYGGGFTLNSGTVIARGTNAFGAGTTPAALNINGGIISANANRNFATKYSSINVGSDFQLGALAVNSPLSTDTAALTFASNVNLGTAATRTITLGNLGTQTLAGTITGTSGLTFAAVTGAGSTVASNGSIAITGTANTFTGAININGPEVSFAADGSLGNTANTVNIDGGRFTITATSTITAARGIQVGSTAGTSISAKGGSTVVTYNGLIANLGSQTGTLVKQGGGTLQLGGASTYTGDTSINNGTLQLTTGSNRLPTGTTVNIGQAASTNVGVLDLNGQNQQIAGLNSTTGTNASTTAKNTVTSTAAATLTLGGSGNYSFGNGTTTNSGVITGAIAVAKTGTGTQVFGDANTYTGGTTVSAGALVVSNAIGSSATGTGAVTVNSNGSLLGTGYINAGANALTINGVLSPGAGTGSAGTINLASTLATGALTLTSTATLAFDLSNTNKDLVALTATSVALGGTLSLFLPDTSSTAIDYSKSYAIFTGVNGLTGAFNSVTGYDATDYTAVLTLNSTEYDLTFTAVTAVPEPATYLGGLLLVAVAIWAKRHQLRGVISCFA